MRTREQQPACDGLPGRWVRAGGVRSLWGEQDQEARGGGKRLVLQGLDSGEKGETGIRKKMQRDRYTDAPPDIADAIKSAVKVVDRFPPPNELRRVLKKSITLRLDPDVYHWFRKPGNGYQTRINMVLRAYMLSKMEKKGTGTKAGRSAKGHASQ